MQGNFRHSLSAAPTYRRDEPIAVRFELHNAGADEYALLTWDTPLGGEVLAFFEVRLGDEAVPYDGRFVSRSDPTAGCYLRIAAGETVAEELDLSTAFSFEEPGTYEVTLHTRFRDAIPSPGAAVAPRPRGEHEGFSLEPLSASFEVLADGAARLTGGQRARAEESTRAEVDEADLRSAFEESRLTIGPGIRRQLDAIDPSETMDFISPDTLDVFATDGNALAWVSAALDELTSWSSRTENALYTEWFGGDDANRYRTVRNHFEAIKRKLTTPHTYDLSPDDCSASATAYTYPGSDTVYLCRPWFSKPATGEDSKFGVFVHEWSHAVAGTTDFAYNRDEVLALAANRPNDAIRNAENHEFFVETLSERMVTAPVVWPNRKVYLFTAGMYYRYDVATDRVDPNYPLPISQGWPGIWSDRVDAGAVWPNRKAYLFRDDKYMSWDIATERADPGYPRSIAADWPGLGGDPIDSVIVWPNRKAYFFRGSQYWRWDIVAQRVDPGYPLPISQGWPGLWGDSITGALTWPSNGKAYFLRGWQYMSYDIDREEVDGGYPRAIAENWPMLWTNPLDAAIFWPQNSYKAYFFRGSQYWRYDNPADRADPGYPLPIADHWDGLGGERIDAALVLSYRVYFFRGETYLRFDIASNTVDSGPSSIAANWPGLGSDPVDAAIAWPETRQVYFFRGAQYWSFDLDSNRVEAGYPRPISTDWPGLWADRIDAVIVWPNRKAYFFRGSRYWRCDVATKRVDPGYPMPIGWNWPNLPGRVR